MPRHTVLTQPEPCGRGAGSALLPRSGLPELCHLCYSTGAASPEGRAPGAKPRTGKSRRLQPHPENRSKAQLCAMKAAVAAQRSFISIFLHPSPSQAAACPRGGSGGVSPACSPQLSSQRSRG